MASFILQATATGLWDSDRPNTPVSSEATAKMTPPTYTLFKFGSVPSAYQYKKILNVKASVWLKPGASSGETGYINAAFRPLVAAWDPSTLTYANAPDSPAAKYSEWVTPYTHNSSGEMVSGTESASEKYLLDSYASRIPVIDAIKNGIRVHTNVTGGYTGRQIATSLDSTYKPTLEVEYGDDVTVDPKGMTPSSGAYIPKRTNCTFRWRTELSGVCVGDLTEAGTVFRWRVTGASSYTEVNCGTDKSYTLPGASITADSIQYQVVTTDSRGNTSASNWITLSTVEATSTAVAESPKNTMVDGSNDIVFSWRHIISTGTAPTRSDLQFSTDGSTWSSLATVTDSRTSKTITANTLPAGEIFWRVRTYNTDAAAGAWSDPVSVLVVAAPAAPSVSTTQTPRPLVSWQSSGQQGYQVRIVGAYESGSIYGVEQSYKLPVILPDGEYAVEVRIVNEYGLWSEWGQASLTVANTMGAAITLNAFAEGSIYLSWSTTGAYTRYLVERDGDPVAVVTGQRYTDYRAVGAHSYRVLGLQDGSDDYTPSNTVTVDLTVEVNSITDLDTGKMLELPYSTTQIREEQITISREVTMTHFAGAAYPSAEIGEGRDRAISFEAAFRDLSQARALEALVGRLVCLKAKNNESVTGVLPGLSKASSEFWVAYTGELTQSDDAEEVEL